MAPLSLTNRPQPAENSAAVEPSTINEKTVTGFTRVVEQTRILSWQLKEPAN
jgi:hypothetical protein